MMADALVFSPRSGKPNGTDLKIVYDRDTLAPSRCWLVERFNFRTAAADPMVAFNFLVLQISQGVVGHVAGRSGRVNPLTVSISVFVPQDAAC